MYLRAKKRIKDGKEHRYWSIVESCRNLDGRVVQRQVLYLGEINDSQKAAWWRTIDRPVLQVDSSAKQMALFPADRLLFVSPVRVLSDDTLYRCLDKLLAHCCSSLCSVGTSRYLTGLFRRRIAWDDGTIREGSGAGEVAFAKNRCC